MKVLITGAGGNLGRSLVPALEAAGHSPRLMDMRALDGPYEFVPGDVRNPDDVKRAAAGVDAIVHAAALHGVHLRTWSPQDFWAINANGTFNVFETAREAGIMRVVLCSTMGVYGSAAKPPEDSWNLMTEAIPNVPSDVYGLSKVVSEQIGEYFAHSQGIITVALRLGMFVPESWERYGFRLLFGGVDDRDVAQAAVLALTHQPASGFDVFNIMADTPFTAMDLEPLQKDPAGVIERYWPGTKQLFANVNLSEVMRGRTVWPPDKAKRLLGYRPRYNFTEFVAAFRAGNVAHYPFANLSWWGVPNPA
jgi:UDP-glucose 4-epimerase